MKHSMLSLALLLATIPATTTSVAAKGPKPAPVGECQMDIGWRMVCAYDTQSECLAAVRSLRRTYRDVQGCYLSTADPDWWHYGRWILQYTP
jgi:hypothetical protein